MHENVYYIHISGLHYMEIIRFARNSDEYLLRRNGRCLNAKARLFSFQHGNQ